MAATLVAAREVAWKVVTRVASTAEKQVVVARAQAFEARAAAACVAAAQAVDATAEVST